MKASKRYAMTLLEIMIVIFIIGIIGSVVGYNMKGSLDESKAFKTREGSRQIYEILTFENAKGTPMSEILKDPKKIISASGMARNNGELMKDGWGNKYDIGFSEKRNDIYISSERYKDFVKAKQKPLEFYMHADKKD
ncbi:MAG: prepilin-type N-terminal cleavage/methylation domain-containing protein [Simkaniaceae bacterium]